MQQTQTYKLNLIETSDVFSPNPLNENTQKTEAALDALSATGSALEQRVVTLEDCRIVIGQYIGNGVVGRIIDLGERPLGVLVCPPAITGTSFAVGDVVLSANQSPTELLLADSGFQVGKLVNGNNTKYSFLAFLGGWDRRDFPQNET